MKTPREKAIEYCMEVEGEIHQPYIDAFLAGYESANEWISVDDEPKVEMWIIAKTEYPKALPFYKSMFYILGNKEQLKINFTHWKPIN